MEVQKQTEASQDEGNTESKVHQVAYELYCENPDWVTFFRRILGRDGIVRQHYDSNEAMLAFERTQTYAEIHQMLAKLREQGIDPENAPESVKVITLRIPESLHDLLRDEADGLRTSVNKLCISKLVQVIEKELVPEEALIRANLAKAKRERELLKEQEAAAAGEAEGEMEQPQVAREAEGEEEADAQAERPKDGRRSRRPSMLEAPGEEEEVGEDV